jgi:hypothetical protein
MSAPADAAAPATPAPAPADAAPATVPAAPAPAADVPKTADAPAAPFYKLLTVWDATLFASQGLAAFTVFQALWDNQSYFALHPRASILGFVTAISGAWCMSSKAAGSLPVRRIVAHQVSMGASTALMTVAFARIWTNKNNFNKPHIQTPHSYLGVASLGLMFLLNGATAQHYYLTDKPRAKEHEKIWWWHKAISKAAITIFGAAVATGAIATFNKKGEYTQTTLQTLAGTIGCIASLGLAQLF